MRVDVESSITHEADQRDACFARKIDREARRCGDRREHRHAGKPCLLDDLERHPPAHHEDRFRQRQSIVEQQSGKGRVILFAGNPCYRWQNFDEFNMLFNTVLNFNDLEGRARAAGTAAQ